MIRSVRQPDSGTLTLTHSTLATNGAGGGGGIYNSGTLTLTHSPLAHNTARRNSGGGIINSSGGTLMLTNSTLAANAAGGSGSGGGSANIGGTLTLTHSTLAANTAGYGSGITNNDGSATLQNTILALNANADDCVGVVTSLGTNLIGEAPGCTITRPPGVSDPTGAPGLATFTDDGTPGNGHFPLVPTSQAIDAGNNAACPPTDQLGQPRVEQCDIGAIEFQPTDTTPPMITMVAIPETLWPPNGKLVPVTIAGTITDAGAGVNASTVTYAVTDEYGSVQPRGHVTVEADGSYAFTIHLQTSRNGKDKDGRQYSITVYAQDLVGNAGSAATGVTVPHDQGH